VAAPLAKPSDPSSHSKQSSTHTPPSAAAPGHHSSSSLTSSSHKRPHESHSSSRSEGHHHSSSQHPHKSLKTSSSSSSSHAIPGPNDGMNGVAIIIVPSAVTSALCSLNCMDFLRDGRYVSVEEKRRSGARREPEMRFEHETKSGRKLLLRLVDTGTKLNDREWARVVAVFVQGQEWQFKGWKWSSPVELFHNVLGFHFMLDDREVDPKILSWNCRVLKVSLSSRLSFSSSS
jgi:parafibromin